MKNSDFDKRFKRTERIVVFSLFMTAVVYLGLLGFAGWFIIKMMSHFGVL